VVTIVSDEPADRGNAKVPYVYIRLAIHWTTEISESVGQRFHLYHHVEFGSLAYSNLNPVYIKRVVISPEIKRLGSEIGRLPTSTFETTNYLLSTP
jgi:hypothetical protein